MEELLDLRKYIEEGRYKDALLLVDELDEMSKEDKLNKIFSFAIVLLIHLIKEKAEQRSTRSWQASIKLSCLEVKRTNKRRRSGGFYASRNELQETLEEAYMIALERASIEAFEGRYDEIELSKMINKENIIQQALDLITSEK